MSTAPALGSRRLALGLPVLALLLLALALPGAAHASATQFCFGTITPITPTAERDTGVNYEVSCHDAITAMAVTTNGELTSFDVTADVFDSSANGGAIRADDRLGECEGEIPGIGFVCAGTYSGQNRVIRGAFDTLTDPCARGADRKTILKAAVVVKTIDGKVNGPYRLGKSIKQCPKPVKKKASGKKNKKTKATHSRRVYA
jgi:hypothetical protein